MTDATSDPYLIRKRISVPNFRIYWLRRCPVTGDGAVLQADKNKESHWLCNRKPYFLAKNIEEGGEPRAQQLVIAIATWDS
jgi:hypothetical protein